MKPIIIIEMDNGYELRARHGNDPSKQSTKNRTRYADNVDPNKIRQETIANPDTIEVLRDANGTPYATRYSKDMGIIYLSRQ